VSLPQKLVLWDIDQRLVDVGGISEEVYADAFHVVSGRPLERLADLHGRTERAITSETLQMHGIQVSEGILASFGIALAAAFMSYEQAVQRRGRALPGARKALRALAGRDEVVQSVLTGNMEPIAVGKLAAFELNGLLDLEVGAYGMDREERSSLVQLAQARAARKYSQSFTAASTVLVGDTPNDVKAGHLGGACVVAVATGGSDQGALRAAGAELVLDDLTDTEAVVQAILRAGGR
jgi:phosphoglycolate phosphatase-like HAD superfamily hydrolase